MDKLDFVLVGVGGQGIVLMSDLLGDAALAAGYDVKKSDVHGMAQRGGSVVSYVRLGEKVSSPLPKLGDVEYLVALEKLEAARWASYLRPGGVAVVNDHAIFPLSVSAGTSSYPTDEQVMAALRSRTEHVYRMDGPEIAASLSNPKVLNVVALGYLTALLPIPWEIWTATVEQRVPPKFRDLNLRALEAGRAAAQA